MKIYELIIIFKNNSKSKIYDFISCFKNFLIYNKFTFLKFEYWGNIKLSYKINNIKKGFFFFLKFFINISFLDKLKIFLKKSVLVIRFFFLSFLKNSYSISSFCLNKLYKKNVFKKYKKKNKKFKSL